MKPIGDAAAKAARYRQWHWCRRANGFCDAPKWRLVAQRLSLPLYQVVAFVNRLEEFANAADQRGYVGHFDPAEFAVALGMPTEDASRIFAALEEPAIGWVAYDHLVTFHDRNPDREDETAANRKRRQRARERVLKLLAGLARRGLVEAAHRTAVENRLKLLADEELFAQLAQLAQLERIEREGVATPVTRDTVTVTPEKSRGAQPASTIEAPPQAGDLASEELRHMLTDKKGQGKLPLPPVELKKRAVR